MPICLYIILSKWLPDQLENIIFPTESDIKSWKESTFSKKKYNMNKKKIDLTFLGKFIY